MSDPVSTVRCGCAGGCEYKTWKKVAGCVLRRGHCEEDLLPGVPPAAHPELEHHRIPVEESKALNKDQVGRMYILYASRG